MTGALRTVNASESDFEMIIYARKMRMSRTYAITNKARKNLALFTNAQAVEIIPKVLY